MAVTIDELVQDIEKRMVALGYEDLNELHNQAHDTKSLKELKRRLMDEAKLLKETKKEKTKLTKELRDVLVKLSKVYKKDLYLYNGIYAIPGKISEESLKGKYILSIKEEFRECIKEILFKNDFNTIIFIRDISELKNLIDENIEEKDLILPRAKELGILDEYNEDRSSSFIEKMDKELECIKIESEFFIPLVIDDESDPDIISFKKIFSIKYKDFPSIECNIQLFPFYTEKEKPSIEFMSENFESNSGTKLYYARFHVNYLYFDIYFKIYYF